MKLLSFAIVIILFGCAKEANDPVFFDGNWSGEMSYLYNDTQVTMEINRSIQKDSTKWYTSPTITSTFRPTGNTYEITYTSDKSGLCTNVPYRHLWVYSGTGKLRNDSLFEQGTYDYKYILTNEVCVHTTGRWTARFGRTRIWKP